MRLIETTPLDDASEFEIESDFMPILKEVRCKMNCGCIIKVYKDLIRSHEAPDMDDCPPSAICPHIIPYSQPQVLGKVPNIILEGAKAVDNDLKRSESTSPATTAAGSDDVSATSAATASFPIEGGSGRSGQVSFDRTKPQANREISAALAVATFPASSIGRSGIVSFERRPVPGPEADAAEASTGLDSEEPPAPPIKIDDETLEAVSRAIMGRLDIVDLVGLAEVRCLLISPFFLAIENESLRDSH